jgi:SAM-dependent methyltransferase
MPAIPLSAPAAERNKEPIAVVLERVLPRRGLVLEVASGTGQHVVHFARRLPGLVWQPSDADAEARASIEAWVATARLPNLRAPLELDVHCEPWPIRQADAVVCINMIHIAPWSAATAFMAGAGRVLRRDGTMVLYGPYRRKCRHTAPSNEIFDEQLRARNPEWGVRDLEAVIDLSHGAGLRLEEVVDMPANNLSVVFRRAQGRDDAEAGSSLIADRG